MVKIRISPKPTLIVDWINRPSMLIAEITPLFMVKSPFFTSGIPDFQRDNDPKTPRGSCAHLPWSLRSSPESSASPRDQKFRREKPRNRETISTEGLATWRTKHKECTEYGDRWRKPRKPVLHLFKSKRKGFPHASWEPHGFVNQQHPKPFFVGKPHI